MSRDRERSAFIASGPWAGGACAPLAGDASSRRYFRLTHPARGSAVLMDAPPEANPDTPAFIDMTERLSRRGFAVPGIHVADPGRGFLLLEDLGDALVARVLAEDPSAEAEIYAAAVDLLADLQAQPGMAEGLPRYYAEDYLREAMLAVEWYLPAAGAAPDAAVSDRYAALVAELCAPLAAGEAVCALRDYHAENLIWRPGRAGRDRIALLDYQGAFAGPRAYDLVSLLEDARRDTSAALQSAMVARYLAATGVEPGPFRAAYAILGAQRNLKILGLFARLWLRDGKPGYLRLLPRVWGHLETDLSHPALSDLAAWVAEHLPMPDDRLIARLRAAR